jgi:hypothetical protein
LSILTQLACGGERRRNSLDTSRKVPHGAADEKNVPTWLAGISLPSTQSSPSTTSDYLRKVICKTQASHLQAPFATLSIHAEPS